MSRHPLLDLSRDREVRQASGFRQAAARLTGERLAADFEREVEAAPRRREAGKRYFVAYNARLAAMRRLQRDGEHLSLALVRHLRAAGSPLALPGEGGDGADSLDLFHAQLPLKSGQADPALGEDDPNFGVGKLDLLGITGDDRLAAVKIKFLAPSAARGGTGDTPLRALLEGLAEAAIAYANREALQNEVAGVSGRVFADARPVLILLGSPRYWELCRRREAQKGAAWIKELERLAQELERDAGIGVRYLAVKLDGDPGWSYPEGAPVLDAPPRIEPAWEIGAGRVRPKPKPKPKAQRTEQVEVEPDLSRPVRRYVVTESYQAGDRIEHRTLGMGVVQGEAGPGKIQVLFDGRKSLLVHGRSQPDAV